jgi:hypothetical protein
MFKPLVTAAIPTRNRPALVCRAVRDAVGQTYGHMEVLGVVDSSNMRTVDVMSDSAGSINHPGLVLVRYATEEWLKPPGNGSHF